MSIKQMIQSIEPINHLANTEKQSNNGHIRRRKVSKTAKMSTKLSKRFPAKQKICNRTSRVPLRKQSIA